MISDDGAWKLRTWGRQGDLFGRKRVSVEHPRQHGQQAAWHGDGSGPAGADADLLTSLCVLAQGEDEQLKKPVLTEHSLRITDNNVSELEANLPVP